MPTRDGSVPVAVSSAFDQGLFDVASEGSLRTNFAFPTWKVPVILTDFADQPMTYTDAADSPPFPWRSLTTTCLSGSRQRSPTGSRSCRWPTVVPGSPKVYSTSTDRALTRT